MGLGDSARDSFEAKKDEPAGQPTAGDSNPASDKPSLVPEKSASRGDAPPATPDWTNFRRWFGDFSSFSTPKRTSRWKPAKQYDYTAFVDRHRAFAFFAGWASQMACIRTHRAMSGDDFECWQEAYRTICRLAQACVAIVPRAGMPPAGLRRHLDSLLAWYGPDGFWASDAGRNTRTFLQEHGGGLDDSFSACLSDDDERIMRFFPDLLGDMGEPYVDAESPKYCLQGFVAGVRNWLKMPNPVDMGIGLCGFALTKRTRNVVAETRAIIADMEVTGLIGESAADTLWEASQLVTMYLDEPPITAAPWDDDYDAQVQALEAAQSAAPGPEDDAADLEVPTNQPIHAPGDGPLIDLQSWIEYKMHLGFWIPRHVCSHAGIPAVPFEFDRTALPSQEEMDRLGPPTPPDQPLVQLAISSDTP